MRQGFEAKRRRRGLVPGLFRPIFEFGAAAEPSGLTPGAGVMLYHRAMNASHQHHDHPDPKLSRNQTEILSCLRQAKEPMSAYAILDRVRTAGISHPPTVYRALADLMQKGMVHRLQSRSAFIACGHGACDGKFAFAICRQCGKVVEIPLSDDDQAALLALAPDEIVPEQVTLELAGLCEACRPS
jgi:Fur family zinc uptake transcriptional regulator